MFLNKKIVSILAIIALVFSSVVPTKAAMAISSASDTLTSSDVSTIATSTVTFTTSTSTASGEYLEVMFPASFATVTPALICPAGFGVNIDDHKFQCVSIGSRPAGTYTMTIGGVRNPNAVGSYLLTISSWNSAGDTLKEKTNILVAIVNAVVMTANVSSNLVFEVRPLATSSTINGATTTSASATTSINFGTLTAGVSQTLGQELRVTTNANNGYSVTIQQNQDLTSGTGAKINPFVDGVASTTAQPWQGPGGTLGQTNTYGHLAFTTDDVSLSGSAFGSNNWRGFSSTTPVEVMYHGGPADGASSSIGMARVAYRVQISGLQPAGDYSNSLVYIATPRF